MHYACLPVWVRRIPTRITRSSSGPTNSMKVNDYYNTIMYRNNIVIYYYYGRNTHIYSLERQHIV